MNEDPDELLEAQPLDLPSDGGFRRTPRNASPWPWLIILLLLLGGGLFLIQSLKDQQEDPLPGPTPTPAPEVTATPEVEDGSRSRELLADLVEQARLWKSRAAPFWAEERWQDFEAKRARGDELLAEARFSAAEEAYEQALEDIKHFETRWESIQVQLFALGEEAYLAGKAEAALALVEAGLVEDASSEEGKALLQKAKRLPELLEAMKSAREAVELQDWALAWLQVERADAFDPEYPGMDSLRDQAKKGLADEEFRRSLSEGLAALEAGRLEQAERSLKEAKGFDANHPALRSFEAQLERALREREVLKRRSQAERFEAEENWKAAHEEWLWLQEADPEAPWAQSGLERSLKWLILQTRIQRAQKALLSAEAADLRAELDTLADLPKGLQADAELFIAEWELMRKPITVKLLSNNETEIRLRGKARWKPFFEREISLPPGRYEFRGSRLGHRDVYKVLVVEPGSAAMELRVESTEGIY